MISYYTSIIIMCWLSLVVLSILVWENNRLSRRRKQMFFLTNVIVALAALMEWLGLQLNGHPSIPTWVLCSVKCADYILTPIAGASLVTQLGMTGIWNKLIKVILIVNTVFQLISAFTGWMLIIDDQNCYSHGPLYSVYIALYCMLMVFIAVDFIFYGKKFRRPNTASLYSILGLVLAGILIQEILGSEFRTAALGMTLGMIMMYIHIMEFSQLKRDDTIQEQQIAITTDALTGASSRYAYAAALDELDKADALPEDLTVFSIDINGLKAVNDSLGHVAGDELICGAADCISKTFLKKGTCYRTGGDEFIVISKMDPEQAQKSLTKLMQNAAEWHGEMVKELHLAAGLARAADHPGFSAEKLIIEADTAMYEEKDSYYYKKRSTAPYE